MSLSGWGFVLVEHDTQCGKFNHKCHGCYGYPGFGTTNRCPIAGWWCIGSTCETPPPSPTHPPFRSTPYMSTYTKQ